MCLGGLIWGFLALIFDQEIAAVVPFSYILLTILNFSLLRYLFRFNFILNFQTFISLLLPFIFQTLLGGFSSSGCVMLWSLFSFCISSLYILKNTRILWLVFYILLVLVSLFLEKHIKVYFQNEISEDTFLLFLGINLITVNLLIFILVFYFVDSIKSTKELLEKTQLNLITSEKMAALGNLSSSIAHEINTPLAVILSSLENDELVELNLINSFQTLYLNLSQHQFDLAMTFLVQLKAHQVYLTTEEERIIKKSLIKKLQNEKIEITDKQVLKLIQMGITNDLPDFLRDFNKQQLNSFIDFTSVFSNSTHRRRNIWLAAEKANNIVLSLKSYNYKNQHNQFTRFHFESSLKSLLALIHKQLEKIDIQLDIEDDVWVEGREDELCQVWMNLINNACQAMSYEGRLLISAKHTDSTVEIIFTDFGCGIAKEHKKRIFDSFYTTKEKGSGTGLGLNISKMIIQSHRGTIKFESEIDMGTSFYISLPKH